MDTWRTCEETGDALIDVEDADSGETLPVRVPWEHRASSIGWGQQKRAHWRSSTTGQPTHGLILSEGHAGVLARDEGGEVHALPHGVFEVFKPTPMKRMAKAVGRDYVIHHDDPIRPGSAADRGGRAGTHREPHQHDPHSDGLPALDGVDGRVRLRVHEPGADRGEAESPPGRVGSGEPSADPAGRGNSALVRQSALLQPGASLDRDADAQLPGHGRPGTSAGRDGRGTPQGEADRGPGRRDPTAPNRGSDLRGPGEGVPGREGSNQPDLHGQGVDNARRVRTDALPAPQEGGAWYNLTKAGKHPPIPAGARWITAHPNGPGSKGQAILVVPAGDGTHRVIGGAGGSMNHLRLRDVKSEGEMRDAQKRKEKAKRQAESERRKGMTKEQIAAEKNADVEKKARVNDAERKVIEAVREKRGGIDRDLTDEDLAGLSPKAQEKLKASHHRKQLAQAMKQRKEVATILASERIEQIEDEAAVDATIRETPDLWSEAHEMGERELALIDAEADARAEVRRPSSNRAEAESRAADAAATADRALSTVDRGQAAADLERLGGRQDDRAGLPPIVGETASAEQRRRAAENIDNALILADAASGRDPSGDPARASLELEVIGDALRAAGVDPGKVDRDDVRTALANEAAIQLQRAQLAHIKATKFEELERAGKAEQALKMLAHTDVQRGLTSQVRDAATKLGLREDAKTPLRQAEVAELMDVLSSFDDLRKAKADLQSVVDEVEKKVPSHDISRRAFDMKVSEPPDHVVETVEEEVRRELATRILGLADSHSSDHAKAVADGHYAKLADVSLAVSNQSHVDRVVVDALGLKNATVLLRHALEQEGHEPTAMHDALVGHHIREQVKITAEALRQADAILPDIEQHVQDAGDIAHAMKRLDASEVDIAQAQRVIGTALGQMESAATMAQAFTGKQPEHLTLEMRDSGQGTMASHLTWLASVGLEPGDYEVDAAKKEIRIPKESWKKLIHTEPKEVVEQRQLAHAIKRGDHDEEGWMPRGMVSRSSTSFTDPPKDAPRYHRPLNLDAEDLHTELADHVGSRLADGERPSDIAHDLLSPNVAGKSHDPRAFGDLVQEMFPNKSEGDIAQEKENSRIRQERGSLSTEYQAAQKAGDDARVAELATQIAALPREQTILPKRDVHFADHYRDMTERFLKRHHPGASTMHAASLYQGTDEEHVREAVFRALGEHPEHTAAFTPIGQLEPKHRKALQDYFYEKAGISDTRSFGKEFGERIGDEVARLKEGDGGASGPAQGQGGMFGGGGGMFGGPPEPAAKPIELSHETFGTLHPKEAKALAYEYPREGAALFRQAMGDRPAPPSTPTKLPEHVTGAIEKIRERHPAMSAPELAKAASKQLGRERAMQEMGVSPEALTKVDATTGQPTTEARRLAAQVEVRAGDLAERGIDPREVQRSYGHLIHDGEIAEFDAYGKKNGTPWSQFVNLHGDLGVALQALQSQMRGDFAEHFAPIYSQVTGRAAPQTGIGEVPNAELHAAAMSTPKGRKELAAQRLAEVRAHQERAAKGTLDETGRALGGQYLTGSALERYRQAKDAETSLAQRQGGLFGAGPPPPGRIVATEPTPKRDPKAGERVTLGDGIENEVSSLITGQLGKTLDPKKKVRLFAGANMDGRRIHQQRVIKMLRANGGRLGAWLGTGSGKSPTSIGAFTELHSHGEASHGLFLVPTAVQTQFGEEMLSFTEPGKYNFETGDNKKHPERVAMLADKGVHMRVLTHESAARTILQMAADHHEVAPEAMLERLRKMPDRERAQTIRDALDAHGVPKHFTYVDEAHGLTTRQGEQESDKSIIIGALAHPINSTHLLAGSATPHKNDTSEVYSMARMLDPERWSNAYKFTQNYGVGSVAAPDAVRREMDHRTYTASIPPDGVSRLDTANPVLGEDGKKTPGGAVPLEPEHRKAVEAVEGAYERANRAHREGRVDVEATRMLSPDRFASASEDKHEAIARELGPSLGIVKETAIRKALQLAPIEHNAKLRRMTEMVDHDVKHGKPSIIFTDSAEEARHVHEAMTARGIPTGLYDGSLDGKARDKFRDQFAKGGIKVGVMTSAGEAGINMQEGRVVHMYDPPKTAKSWAQRAGRAYRQGQKNDVEVHDWTFDHPHDANATRRLQDKSRLAEVFQTPLGPLDEHGFAHDYHAVLNKRHESFDPAALAPLKSSR